MLAGGASARPAAGPRNSATLGGAGKDRPWQSCFVLRLTFHA
jgi:hypothetical protein